MDINEIYTRVAKSLDVVIEDDYLRVKDGDKLVNLTANGKPMVLPTKKNIATMLDENDDGEIIKVKQLFNPLDETVIKGDSATLSKLKKLVEIRLANRVTVVGSLLLTIAENEKHQAKTSMLVNQFLIRLNEAKNPGMTKVVDDKTADKWIRMYDQSFGSSDTKFLTVYTKKGGKLGTTKYNRVATLKFPVYEELCKLGKSGKINGVSLRNKDIKVFKMLFEYLVEGVNERGVVAKGSNDKESPGFISLFSLYLKAMGKIQEVLGDISGVDQEWEDSGVVELCVDISELSELSVYKRELAKIPREGDVIKSRLSNTRPTITNPGIPDTITNNNNIPRVSSDDQQYGQPATNLQPQQPEGNPSTAAIRKAVYGTGAGMAGPGGYPVQDPRYNQQPQPPAYNYPPVGGYPNNPQYQAPIQDPRYGVYGQGGGYPPAGQPGMYAPRSVSIGEVGNTSAFGAGTTPTRPMVNPNGMWNR